MNYREGNQRLNRFRCAQSDVAGGGTEEQDCRAQSQSSLKK